MKVLVIEPCYFGLGYLRALPKMSIACVVATSDINFPDIHGYRDLIEFVVVCAVSNSNEIQSAMHRQIPQLYFMPADVNGNQFRYGVCSRVCRQARFARYDYICMQTLVYTRIKHVLHTNVTPPRL